MLFKDKPVTWEVEIEKKFLYTILHEYKIKQKYLNFL